MTTQPHWFTGGTTGGLRAIAPLATRFSLVRQDWVLQLRAKWGGYCEGFFRELAQVRPDELASLITQGLLGSAHLSLAAESIGLWNDATQVRSTLTPLLEHGSAVVREGAIYGLRPHLNPAIRERLHTIAQNDASIGVRDAALEAAADDD